MTSKPAAKTSAGSFIDSATGLNKLAQWNCQKCSFLNKGASKKCEMCEEKAPDRKLPLSLSVTVPFHSEFATKPLLLVDLKHHVSLGYLRDLLEAKTGVRDSKQLIFNSNTNQQLKGNPDDFLVTILQGVNIADVIRLTLYSVDNYPGPTHQLAEAPSSSASSFPSKPPSLRKKSSRSRKTPSGTPAMSRQNSTESESGTGNAAAGGNDWKDEETGDGWDEEGGEEWDDDNFEDGEDDEDEEEHKASDSPRKTPNAAATPSSSSSSAVAAASTPSAAASPALVSYTSFAAQAVAAPTPYAAFYAKTSNYILRKPSQLEAHVQTNFLDDLSELLGITSSEAGILLRNYKDKWNRRRIEEQWMNDADTVRNEAGLGPYQEEDADQDPTSLVECQTCGDDEVLQKDSFALSCGHRFCNECWKNWIVAEFDKGPTCIKTRCQGLKCQVIVPSDRQMSFLPIEKREKLTRWLLDDFVSFHNKNFKNCPHSDCNMNAERMEGVRHVGGVDCACATAWCFDCTLEDHRPASCEDAKKWHEKNNSDAENVNWILANTKVCPSCNVHIEKNQGCNHMTCRKCSHEFCWLCKGPWKDHSSCANYSASTGTTKETQAAESAQNALKKYMHYWSRFDNHAKSIKFAEKTRKQAEERMEQLQSLKGTGLLEVQFIVDAVNCVIANKRILQWLYVYAYYFEAPEGSSDRALFEMHQQQLEKFTDELHGLSEQPLELLLKPETRVKMISFVSTVQKYRNHVMEAVEAANEKTRRKKEDAAAASSSSSSSEAPAPASKPVLEKSKSGNSFSKKVKIVRK